MHVADFLDKENQVPVGPGIELGGKSVHRQQGMIYWYRWGSHTFDVRVMRKVMGLPEDHAADKWFMDANPYAGQPERAFQEIVEQLRNALAGRSFATLLADHDTAMVRKAVARREADRQMPRRDPNAMSIPTTRPIYHNNKLSIIRPGLTFEAIDKAVYDAACLVTGLRGKREHLARTQGKRGNLAAARGHQRAARELRRVEQILDAITTPIEIPF